MLCLDPRGPQFSPLSPRLGAPLPGRRLLPRGRRGPPQPQEERYRRALRQVQVRRPPPRRGRRILRRRSGSLYAAPDLLLHLGHRCRLHGRDGGGMNDATRAEKQQFIVRSGVPSLATNVKI